MYLPKGYTEPQVIAIIQAIAARLAGKFKFGYHELEDMKQQVYIEILTPDRKGFNALEKFDPANGAPLDSFLWVHVRNHLHNFKRNNFARPDKPCDNCPLAAYVNFECTAFSNMNDCEIYDRWEARNQSKKSLMATKEESSGTIDEADGIDKLSHGKEIFSIINDNIHYSFREDWIRFTNRLKLSKKRREELMAEILSILQAKNIELPDEFVEKFGGADNG